jgi:hypothetical protein
MPGMKKDILINGSAAENTTGASLYARRRKLEFISYRIASISSYIA